MGVQESNLAASLGVRGSEPVALFSEYLGLNPESKFDHEAGAAPQGCWGLGQG